MQEKDGIYYPDEDSHFIAFDCEDYQHRPRNKVLKYVKQKIVVADVGAHVGLWARHFCKKFRHVILFEPNKMARECLHKNLEQFDNWTLHSVALGDEHKEVKIVSTVTKGNTGTAIVVDGDDVDMITLDSLNLNRLDLLKIDVEGDEYKVLRGARDTLVRCKPVIIYEEAGLPEERYQTPYEKIREYLIGLGFKFQGKMCKECMFTWDESGKI